MTPLNDHATFWEHVEELRSCLIKIIFIIILGMLTTFLFYPSIISILSLPFENLQKQSQAELSEQKVNYTKISNLKTTPQLYTLPQGTKYVAPLSEGVKKENENIYHIETNGFLTYESLTTEKKLIILGPTEGLMTAFKVSFWVGLSLTSPFWLYLLAAFITPALQREEAQALFPFFFFSICFFSLGVLFSYLVTIPFANNYLTLFNEEVGKNLWSLTYYLDYTLILMLANGIAFETGVVLFFLVHYRFITHDTMIQKRRYAIVGAFILGAILTPPDIMTQLMLALPLIILYEAAILYAAFLSKKTSLQSLNKQ